jgi:O-antigen chain-terminating methyltransferase
MPDSLAALVGALPEVYQPIFGHPELSRAVSRPCDDRLAQIGQIYHDLAARLGRPLRVLDLGCAQGFFSIGLAQLGATVHGVDFLPANVALCQAMAAERPDLALSFEVCRIESAIAGLEPNQYDLVLGLSVFHHIVHVRGATIVQTMLRALAEDVAAGLFEIALATEPLYWARRQLKNPRQLLSGFAFVHEIGQCGTHLSDVTRPFYFASNRYWHLNGELGAFDSWRDDSHSFARGTHEGTRRYFFGGDAIAKVFYLEQPARDPGPIARLRGREAPARRTLNSAEQANETAFLQNPPQGYPAPTLHLHGSHDREAWLVREQVPGDLLIDLMLDGGAYDATSVLDDILVQLAALEATGRYHNDLRPWNIVIRPDKRAVLIDYGSISTKRADCVWPGDVFLAFMVLVYEVTRRRVERHGNVPLLSISPYRRLAAAPRLLSEPYRGWMRAVWAEPRETWSFARMRELLEDVKPTSAALPPILK